MEIFRLFGSILVNNDEANKSIQQTGTEAEKSGGALSKLGEVGEKFGVKFNIGLDTVATAAGNLTSTFGKMALDGGMQLEATEAKYNTVFAGMTEIADQFIKDFQKLTPATTAEARSMASGIQDLLIPMGFMRDEATQMTGDTMHLIGALTNFNSATQTAESVQAKFASALTGNTDGLKALGIQISAANIEQYALENGYAKTKDQIDNNVKAQVILAMAYEQSGDALAAYNKNSLDVSTKLELAKKQFENIAAEIGYKFIPILSFLADNLNIIVPIVTSFAIVLNVLKVALGIVNIIDVFSKSTLLMAAAQNAATAAQWALNAAMNANPIGLIILGITALILIIKGLWDTNEEFRNSIIEIMKSIETAFKNGLDTASELIKSLIDFFKKLPGNIYNFFKEIVTGFIETMKELKEQAKEKVAEFADKFIEFFKDLPNKMKEIGKNILAGIWNGINEKAEWLTGKVKDFFSGIINTAKDVLGIHSPSVVFSGMGTNVASSFINSVLGEKSNVENAVGKVFGELDKDIDMGLNLNAALQKTPYLKFGSNNDLETSKGAGGNVFNINMSIDAESLKDVFGLIKTLEDLKRFARAGAV